MDNKLLGIGSRVNHPAYGPGVVIGSEVAAYKVCFISQGIKHVGKQYSAWEIVEAIEDESAVSFSLAEKSLIKILKTWSDITEVVPMHNKWNNGKMILVPGATEMKEKEVPIEVFFHKIVMIRDRLRVMEQRINSSMVLSEEDKINLQQYITRIYGSLTTFNVLFQQKEDYFVGEKSE
ncbi:MAG TPA: hypothetical protein DCX89_07975 [Saprospirales bacterium]|nr:hypothetical protein [Saprospirales bacterium]HRQ29279.1 hypothetical protein [Saprospiraceae bacterium]